MKYVLQPVKGVDDDIVEAVEWYESKQEGLGVRFLEDWENVVNFVLVFPFAFQKKKKSFRQALLKSFPYMIIYEVINYKVVVYAVIQVNRHPDKRFVRKK